MIVLDQIVQLEKSKVRIEATLSKTFESRIRVNIIEFKSSFTKWPKPQYIGIQGSSLQTNEFFEINEAIARLENFEHECSLYFDLKKSLSEKLEVTRESLNGETKDSVELSFWVFANLHIRARQFRERDVFVLDMRNIHHSTIPVSPGIYRLGTEDLREFFLAVREVAFEIKKINAKLQGLPIPLPPSIEEVAPLPSYLEVSSESFPEQIRADELDHALDQASRMFYSLSNGQSWSLKELLEQKVLNPRQEEEILSEANLSILARSTHRTQSDESPEQPAKPSATQAPKKRSKKPPTEKNTQMNEALTQGPMPWPLNVNRECSEPEKNES